VCRKHKRENYSCRVILISFNLCLFKNFECVTCWVEFIDLLIIKCLNYVLFICSEHLYICYTLEITSYRFALRIGLHPNNFFALKKRMLKSLQFFWVANESALKSFNPSHCLYSIKPNKILWSGHLILKFNYLI
jgi:hypothetical protein